MAVTSVPMLGLLLLTSTAWIGSCLFILRAVWARHRGNRAELRQDEKLWFFGHIAGMTRQEHSAAVRSWSEERMEESMTAQNYILSCNVQKKYNALNWAITPTIVALILLLTMGVVYALTMRSMS